MRALILGPPERRKIAELRDRAAANPLGLEELKRRSEGFDPGNPTTREGRENARIPLDFTIRLPDGWTVTYTLERQPPGLCRHMSVSVNAPGLAPSPYGVGLLMNAFGFAALQGVPEELMPSVLPEIAASGRLYVYVETYAAGLQAVNIVEAVELADLTN